ncbi:HAD family hydrolase, partial [Candidatus Bathyarchaeota archaeon]|nr:HAD family hydrolase [Candidatus Bathyarchaeota archaeon]
MRFEAVVFDLDGVLIDSRLDYRRMREAIRELLREAGVELEGFDGLKIWEMLNLAHKRYIELGGSEADWGRLMRRIDEALSRIELEALPRVKMNPEAPEVLRALRARGLKIGVATRSCRLYAERSLERVGLRRYVDALLARDDVPHPKPDPRHLLAVIELLKVDPSEVLYIGDTTTDLEAARRAGVPFLGFLTQTEWSRRLLEEDCQVIENLGELLSY